MEGGSAVKDREGRTVTTDSDTDVVARVVRGGLWLALICECKFTRRRPSRQELEDDSRRARKGGENIGYVMFSRSGFTSEFRTWPKSAAISVWSR